MIKIKYIFLYISLQKNNFNLFFNIKYGLNKLFPKKISIFQIINLEFLFSHSK